ncbi:MAG: succinate dehydrogenase, hydrophobic membrane anchor protein [Armatimonadota bacterium]
MRGDFWGTPRPAGGFELYAWLFTRVSGVLLIFLVLGHFAVMHLITGVQRIDYQFVVQRYRTPFWRTWDMAMLILAILHGMNGLRVVVQDYIPSRGWRLAAVTAVGVLAFLFVVAGILPILTTVPAGGSYWEVARHGP